MTTEHASTEADPILSDPTVAPWLARKTHTPERVVQDELATAAARRAFVVDELLDAELSEPAVLDGTIRLTGLSEEDAAELVHEHERARGRRAPSASSDWVEVEPGIFRQRRDPDR